MKNINDLYCTSSFERLLSILFWRLKLENVLFSVILIVLI